MTGSPVRYYLAIRDSTRVIYPHFLTYRKWRSPALERELNLSVRLLQRNVTCVNSHYVALRKRPCVAPTGTIGESLYFDGGISLGTERSVTQDTYMAVKGLSHRKQCTTNSLYIVEISLQVNRAAHCTFLQVMNAILPLLDCSPVSNWNIALTSLVAQVVDYFRHRVTGLCQDSLTDIS